MPTHSVASITALIDVLDELATLLREHDEDYYQQWVEGDAGSLRAGDLHGAEHFLSGFVSLGDFQDIVLTQSHGTPLDETERGVASYELHRLLSAGVALAEALLRKADSGE